MHFHLQHLIYIRKRSKARVEPEVHCLKRSCILASSDWTWFDIAITIWYICTSQYLPEVGVVWYQLIQQVVSRLCVN